MARQLSCLAVCAPGLEPILRGELERGRTVRGGVEIRASPRELYAANVGLRTATRVLVRLASFRARSFPELEAGVAAIEWDRWVDPAATVRVRASSSASRLYHTSAIAERVVRASGRAAGRDQLIVVRIQRDTVVVSIDSSGAPLHERGWRQAQAKAPLRETLAAAMLLAAGWDGTEPLADPLCGSGTIPIEAALLATGAPPGRGRGFAFQSWPSFEPGTWASVAADTAAAGHEPTVPISASDRDRGAVEATRGNAERAGVTGVIDVTAAPLSDAKPAGWVITNPPYGRRVAGGADLRNLYARLGHVSAGSSLGLLIADRRLANHTGRHLRERFRTKNGGIPVRFLTATP